MRNGHEPDDLPSPWLLRDAQAHLAVLFIAICASLAVVPVLFALLWPRAAPTPVPPGGLSVGPGPSAELGGEPRAVEEEVAAFEPVAFDMLSALSHEASASRPAGAAPGELRRTIRRLEGLHERPDLPRRGEWLSVHDEPGQSFVEYLRGRPTVATERRRVLLVQPLGALDTGQQRLVARTALFLSLYYGLAVRVAAPLALRGLPRGASRRLDGERQLRTGWLLQQVLAPLVTDETVAVLGLTGEDLYPAANWRFVFGQATLRDRVGVWSLRRLGPTVGDEAEVQRTLLRTLKVAAHETGHMLGILHCTAWRCLMAGSNNLAEVDHTPLALCPEDLAKVAWATQTDPRRRYRGLHAFSQEMGLAEQAAAFAALEAALEAEGPVSSRPLRPRPAGADQPR